MIPSTINDPFTLQGSTIHQQPVVSLGLSLLQELRNARPESNVGKVVIRFLKDGSNLTFRDHKSDSSPRFTFLFNWHSTRTSISVAGRLKIGNNPTLDMHGLQELKRKLYEGLVKQIVCNTSTAAGHLEMADFVAAHFVQGQQDLALHAIHINHRPPNPALHSSTYTMYGRPNMDSANLEALKLDGKSRFFVALGSNVGDRLDMIEKACREMEEEGMQVVRTSGLWETKAMYVEDQANFLNGVCEVSPPPLTEHLCTKNVLKMRERQVISTDKNPEALLIKLKGIEARLGRVKVIEKGPRSIDLDVLLWNHESYENRNTKLPISVPHKLMREREFVLRPLCE